MTVIIHERSTNHNLFTLFELTLTLWLVISQTIVIIKMREENPIKFTCRKNITARFGAFSYLDLDSPSTGFGALAGVPVWKVNLM